MRLLAVLALVLLVVVWWLSRGANTPTERAVAIDAAIIARPITRASAPAIPALHGTVIARDTGERLDGAIVILVEDDEHAVASTVSDRDGRFTLPPREGMLFARARGYASPAMVPAADGVVLICDRALAIRGRVVSHGAGVGDVTVKAMSMFASPTVEAVTDGDGRFEMLGMARDTYDLVVDGSRLVKHVDRIVEVDDRDAEVEIEVERGWTLRGRLEPPIAAHVQAGPHEVESVDGSFELRGMSGNEVINAYADDGRHGRVMLDVRRDVDGVVVPMEVGASVRGTIVDPQGRPLAGAIAVVGFATATSASDGTFRVVGLRGGKQHVTAKWPDYGVGSSEELWLKDGEETDGIVLTLARRDRTLRGRVLRDGRPIAGVSVQARSDGQPVYDPVVSGDDGGFAIAGVIAADYQLIAHVSGWRGTATTTPDRAVDIALEAQAALSGRVTLDGAPVPVFDLACAGPTRVDMRIADPDGRYRVDDLIPGPYTCNYSSRDGQGMSLELHVETELTMNMALDRFATVVGRLVDARSGAPVAGVSVSVPRERDWIDHYRSDADGRFKIERVEAGPGQVRAKSDAGIWPGLGSDGSYDAHPNERVDVGDVRIIPSRPGGPGTVGLGFDANGVIDVVREPAAAAGIVVGDHLRGVDGITDPAAWMLMLGDNLVRAGETLTVTTSRATVTLTAVPYE